MVEQWSPKPPVAGSNPVSPAIFHGGGLMKAIDLVAKNHKTLQKEDIILLSCPDLVEGVNLPKPDWCSEIQIDIRIPQKGYNCHMCWHRDVTNIATQKVSKKKRV